jgi:hypothetical protein
VPGLRRAGEASTVIATRTCVVSGNRAIVLD